MIWVLARIDDFDNQIIHLFKEYPSKEDILKIENLDIDEFDLSELISNSIVLTDVSVRGEEYLKLYQDDIFTDNSK